VLNGSGQFTTGTFGVGANPSTGDPLDYYQTVIYKIQ
jgi:hypothetical protein